MTDDQKAAFRYLALRSLTPGMSEEEEKKFVEEIRSRPDWFNLTEPEEMAYGGKKYCI